MEDVQKENGAAPVEETEAKKSENGVKKEEAPRERILVKPERVEKPDREEMESTVNALNEKIETQQLRITEIRTAIEAKRGNRKHSGAMQGVRGELVACRQEFKRALEVKNNIRTELQAADIARDTLRGELKGMKDKLNFMSIKDIENEIRRIEERMAHSTLTLDEEKRLVSQLATLNKSRDVVKGFGARQEKLSSGEDERKAVLDKLKAQDAVLDEIKAREGVLQAQMAEARSKEQSENEDIPSMIAEREACIAKIKEIRSEIRKIRDAFRAKENEYYNKRREFYAWLKQEREDKNVKYAEERKERDAERKRRAAENAPPAFYEEIMACEQLLGYLDKFTIQEKPAEETAPSTSGFENDDGLTLKQRPEDNDGLEDLFSGKQKGSKGKKKKGTRKARGVAPSGTDKLPHSIETYTSFSKVGVTIPVVVNDVEGSVTALKEKLDVFKEKQRVSEEARKAKLEAEEAAAAEDGGAEPASKDEAMVEAE